MANKERTPVANIVPFGLRMQPELKTRIEEAAAKNERSINSEIVARLEASFNLEQRAETQRLLRESSDFMVDQYAKMHDDLVREVKVLREEIRSLISSKS